MQQVRRQDKTAMKMLYDRYVGYLTAVCARYIPDDDDVKDILQEAFIKIFQSMDRFSWRGEGSLKAWMTRIVVNDSCRMSLTSSSSGTYRAHTAVRYPTYWP